MVKGAPDYKGIVDHVHRPDIYREVAKEMGVAAPREDMKKETFFDGVDVRSRASPKSTRRDFPVSNHGVEERHMLNKRIESDRADLAAASGVGAGAARSGRVSADVAPDLPSPLKTWHEVSSYVLDPFFKDGEMNQGIGRFAF